MVQGVTVIFWYQTKEISATITKEISATIYKSLQPLVETSIDCIR